MSLDRHLRRDDLLPKAETEDGFCASWQVAQKEHHTRRTPGYSSDSVILQVSIVPQEGTADQLDQVLPKSRRYSDRR